MSFNNNSLHIFMAKAAYSENDMFFRRKIKMIKLLGLNMKLATVIQLIGCESITECVFVTRSAIKVLGMTTAPLCRQQLIAEGFELSRPIDVSARIFCFPINKARRA